MQEWNIVRFYSTIVHPAQPGRNQEEHDMARQPLITSKDQVAPEHHKIADAVIASRGGIHGPFTVLMHCPDIAAHLEALGGYVRFKGKLDMRVRVLAAMVVAREFETLYVWGAQSGSARRQKVPESTITAIREKHSRGLPPEDAQIVDFTRALLEKHRVDDALAQAVLKRFGNEQFIELTGTIGYYSLLCMSANACELPPGKDHEVLKV
jgi:4-carboxymuconolactone decarboxylase